MEDLNNSPFFDIDSELLKSAWGISLMRRCRAGLLMEDSVSRDGFLSTCFETPLVCPVVSVVGSEDDIKVTSCRCYAVMLLLQVEQVEPWRRFSSKSDACRVLEVDGGKHLFMQLPSKSAALEQPAQSKAYKAWVDLFHLELEMILGPGLCCK